MRRPRSTVNPLKAPRVGSVLCSQAAADLKTQLQARQFPVDAQVGALGILVFVPNRDWERRVRGLAGVSFGGFALTYTRTGPITIAGPGAR